MKGNQSMLDAAMNVYRSFREQLVQRTKTYKQPSMKEFFRKPEWKAKLTELEHNLR
jgi:hypothetical protein